jgi:hypothetical protein
MRRKKSCSKPTSKKTDVQYDASEWNESTSIEVTPEPRLKTGVSTSIRLPADMIRKLRRIAGRKGDIGYQTLIKIWIAERLEQELDKGLRPAQRISKPAI